MKYYLKENKNVFVKSNVAVNGVIKLIRKIVRRMKEAKTNHIGVKDELVIVDERGNEHFYIYKIERNTNRTKNDFYSFDYEINLFKKLTVK